MTIGTRLYTLFAGEKVGEDAAGNRYYRDRFGAKRSEGRREKRWVLYSGEREATRVPSEWYAWLHHQAAESPSGRERRWPWQKPREPNRTGTALAYLPPGHELRGGRRDKATGDYQAWTPPS